MHKLQQLLASLLDFLFPKSQAEQSIASLSPEEFAMRAQRRTEEPHDAITALFAYRDPLVQAAIWALKYHRNTHAAALLATPLYEEILAIAGDVHAFDGAVQLLLVPIPLSHERFHERGYNQAELLGEAVCALDEANMLKLSTNILERTRHTKSQTSIKNRKERIENVTGCFAVAQPEAVTNRAIILLDDVTTTGATLAEARRVLLEAGAASVFPIACAH